MGILGPLASPFFLPFRNGFLSVDFTFLGSSYFLWYLTFMVAEKFFSFFRSRVVKTSFLEVRFKKFVESFFMVPKFPSQA